MDELNRANRLNDDWDALVRGETRGVDPALADDLLRLRHAIETPGPSAEFAEGLWQGLMLARPAARRVERRRRLAPLALAAVLAVALISAALVAVLIDDDTPSGSIAVATQPATATSPAPTTTPAPAPSQTPQIAAVSPTTPPTATSPAETPPATTPTTDPNATVPTGPTPPVQAGGAPVYETLDQLVNAADLVVAATVSDEVTTNADGATLRAIDVTREIRGTPPERVYLPDYGEYQPGESLVLFLQHVAWGPGDFWAPVGGAGVIPLADGAVADGGDGRGWPIAQQYAGQPLDALVAAIDAIPDIDPAIQDLLDAHGWTSLGKQALWPLALPSRDGFADARVLPYMPYSWEAVLAASRRVGLDFASLAGQDAQLLVYFVERDPSEPRIRPVWAAVLVRDQQIAGAWVAVSGAERPFGLDERDAALAEPAYVPTPAPTPTPATPSGETVNPARLYGLAGTETFTFCWPYCGIEPQTVALRDALVAALDVELPIQPVEAHPTPTEPRDLVQADGSFVWLVFGYLEPGWPAEAFGYDRDAELLLLPRNAAWAPAPDALVEIMAGVEPPPLPTKP